MAGVDHIITHGVVRYPGEVGGAGSDGPYILHYGIDFTIDHTYNWNKMSYQKLDLYACKGLFFGAPPAGSGSPRHVAMRFVVNTLNSAFCDFYHSDRCDASTKAHLVPCPPHTRPVEAPCAVHDLHCCKDQQPTCWQWALDEQCEANKAFMEGACRLSCGLCSARADAAETALPLERPTMQPLDTSSRLTKVAASLSDARGAAEAHGTKRAAVLGLSQSAVGEAVLERAAADEEAARATARATGATDSDASPSSPVAAATTAEVAPVHSHPQANAPAHTYTDIAPAHVQNAPAHTHTDIAPTHVQNAPAHTYTDIAPTHVQNAPAHMHTDIAPAHRVQAPSHHPLPAVLHHSASPSHAPSPIVGHGKTAHALHAPGGSNLPSHAAVPRPGAPRSQSPAAETVLDDLRRVAEEHKASCASTVLSTALFTALPQPRMLAQRLDSLGIRHLVPAGTRQATCPNGSISRPTEVRLPSSRTAREQAARRAIPPWRRRRQRGARPQQCCTPSTGVPRRWMSTPPPTMSTTATAGCCLR